MQLTTTSYAILGQLALQPWTMYDLAQQMRRNVHFFFPRAESQIYTEPRRLVEAGLAAAEVTMTGRRKRTTYRITDKGMTALKDWLASEPAKGASLEFEALLRVIMAPLGTPGDLEQTLHHTKAAIAPLLELAVKIQAEYLSGTAPFQRHVLTRSLMHDLLCSFGELIDTWADRSLARITAWPDQTEEERLEAAMEIFRTKPVRRPRL